MASKKKQTVTVDVETVGSRKPYAVVLDVLRANPQVTNVFVEDYSDVEEVPGPNRARLIKLAQWAAGEDAKRQLGLPNEWNQGSWLSKLGEDEAAVTGCGTACCIAGKVAIEDGGVPVIDEFGDWDQAEPGYDTGRVIFPEKDAEEEVYVSEYAQKALGLNERQASLLFSGSNNLQSVLDAVAQILREAGPEMVTVRRLKAGRTEGNCPDGESCDICYEDVEVPADQAEAVSA